MAYLRYNFRSLVLNMYTSLTIIYPSNTHKPNRAKYVPGMRYQTLYLMHGGGEDDTFWLRRSRIEDYAEDNQLMIVCPSTHGGIFANTAYGMNFDTYITQEVPEIARTFFAAALERENSFIAGQGMGAGGALSLALRHPDVYSVCVSLTPGIGAELDTMEMLRRIERMPMIRNVYGSPEDYIKNDLFQVCVKNKADGVELPKIYLNSEDGEPGLRATVNRQYDILKMLGYDVTLEYTIGPGHDHRNGIYCDKYIKRAIEEWLPLTKSPIYPK